MSDHWIITYTGKRFDLVEPNRDDIDIVDIAHALARIPHWNGHTHGDIAFSVAQHSIMVAWAMEQVGQSALAGLMHDAEEAYIGDITRPMKVLMAQHGGREVLNICEQLQNKIYIKYGCEAYASPYAPGMQHVEALKQCDDAVLNWEARNLANREGLERHGSSLGQNAMFPIKQTGDGPCGLPFDNTVYLMQPKWATEYSFTALTKPWTAAVAKERFLSAFYKLSK